MERRVSTNIIRPRNPSIGRIRDWFVVQETLEGARYRLISIIFFLFFFLFFFDIKIALILFYELIRIHNFFEMEM